MILRNYAFEDIPNRIRWQMLSSITSSGNIHRDWDINDFTLWDKDSQALYDFHYSAHYHGNDQWSRICGQDSRFYGLRHTF